MLARFRRIIHQQAQYRHSRLLTVILRAVISMVFTKLLLENALAVRPCNYEAALEPLSPKVARCIPGSIASNLYDVPSATFFADFESTCVETNIVFAKI